jgi:hypothetical protein
MPQAVVIESKINIHKYPMMRKMFERVGTPWVVWFDDDSYVITPGWLTKLFQLAVRLKQPIGVFGKKYSFDLHEGQLEWIQDAPWFTGQPPLIAFDSRRLIASFITGGFQLIRTAVIRKLDWPDPRLDHNGGDVMFGEACRQNGILCWDTLPEQYGIVISGAERRGFVQRPVGITAFKPIAIDAMKNSKTFYLDDNALTELLANGILYQVLPALEPSHKMLDEQLLQVKLLEGQLTTGEGCEGCKKSKVQVALHLKRATLMAIAHKSLATARSPAIQLLWDHLKTTYSSKVTSIFCVNIGWLVRNGEVVGQLQSATR